MSSRIWLPALCLCAAACGPEAAPSPSLPPSSARPAIAAGSYLLRVPPQDLGLLRAQLAAQGLTPRHEFSDLVGLRGAVAVDADPAAVRGMLAAMPGLLEVQAEPLRYALDCGDGTCDAGEAQTDARTTTCSFDCGTPPPPDTQDELQNSWQVPLIGADQVWAQSQGAGVDVAVLDTGYDSGAASRHPDRPKNLGYGYNFSKKADDFSDVDEHGTHVIGIVAAARNGKGSVGVAPEAIIHPFQVFTPGANGQLGARSGDLIAAIDAAVQKGYKVLNMSLGGPSDSAMEHEALRRAYAAGLLLVASAGNSEDPANGAVGTAPQNFPGAYPETLSVGATSRAEGIAGFSATGATVIVSAPGASVYSTVPMARGAREAAAVFDLPGVGRRPLLVQCPPGSSRTFLENAEVVACGLGSTGEVASCRPNGKVALIRRGPVNGVPLTFRDKIDNARRLGAIGVLLYNHRDGEPAVAGALLDSINLGTSHPVPVYTLAAGDGEFLVAATQKGTVRVVSASYINSNYDRLSGTSMAAPVVTGLAALLWAKSPALTNVQVRQLIAESAVDLGAPGRDDLFGWGRVDARRAFALGTPRARCGDGRVDPESEICDGLALGNESCDARGYDDQAGGKLACNATCTGIDESGCQCVPGRMPFDGTQMVQMGVMQNGVPGVLVTYKVMLNGTPVRGAQVRVTIKQGDQNIVTYQTDKTDQNGMVRDFFQTEKSGFAAGTYQFNPVMNKGLTKCHPDKPLDPFNVVIKS